MVIWSRTKRSVVLSLAVGVTLLLGSAALIRHRGDAEEETQPVAEQSGPAEPVIVPLEGPLVVAIQPGHWKIDELPAEAARRERGIGAVYGDARELDINLAVVDALVPLLEAEQWTVVVVPATVPPGLRADAFLSVHADWANDPARRGWKLAPPWRPSGAASDLAEALRASFRLEGQLREDVGGVTVGMRGYFGFSPTRYVHASSPYTPAVLVELGFVTNATDRTLMLSSPEYFARILHRGLVNHFASWDRSNVESLIPKEFDSLAVGMLGAEARRSPDATSGTIRGLEPGEVVRPVDERDDWYEIRFRNPNQIGWVQKTDLVPLSVSLSADSALKT